MRTSATILGIDFTSAPSARKPITCVRAHFDGGVLAFEELLHLHDFDAFESLLAAPGEWVAGMDFPFGQPRRLVENIGWPQSWAGYMQHVAGLDRNGFRLALEEYKQDRPPGDKHHKRGCDKLTRSQSPQTLFGTPVGLMFYEGAPRLLQSGVHLPYNHDGDGARVVLEEYPGVAARRLVGGISYKSDTRAKQTAEQHAARQQLLSELIGETGQRVYGFTVDAPMRLADDPSADELDALICAVQAAWGHRHADANYGAPDSVDRLEGWICDPSLQCSAIVG